MCNFVCKCNCKRFIAFIVLIGVLIYEGIFWNKMYNNFRPVENQETVAVVSVSKECVNNTISTNGCKKNVEKVYEDTENTGSVFTYSRTFLALLICFTVLSIFVAGGLIYLIFSNEDYIRLRKLEELTSMASNAENICKKTETVKKITGEVVETVTEEKAYKYFISALGDI